MPLITSRATVEVDGIGRLAIKEGAEINFGHLKRESIMGDSGVLGHTEKYDSAPMIKVTILDSQGVDKSALQNFVSGNVVLMTNNGQSFSLSEAYLSNQLNLNTSSGEIELEFFGSKLNQLA